MFRLHSTKGSGGGSVWGEDLYFEKPSKQQNYNTIIHISCRFIPNCALKPLASMVSLFVMSRVAPKSLSQVVYNLSSGTRCFWDRPWLQTTEQHSVGFAASDACERCKQRAKCTLKVTGVHVTKDCEISKVSMSFLWVKGQLLFWVLQDTGVVFHDVLLWEKNFYDVYLCKTSHSWWLRVQRFPGILLLKGK